MKYMYALQLISVIVCLLSVVYRDRKYPLDGTDCTRWYQSLSHRIALGAWGVMVVSSIGFGWMYVEGM